MGDRRRPRGAGSTDRAEEATVRAFIVAAARPDYLRALRDPSRRREFLDRLNHCRDLDERLAVPVRSMVQVVAELRRRGAPGECHVISDSVEIDGKDLTLARAVEEAEALGWGTLIICLPGRLACYVDEFGTGRILILVAAA